MTDAIPSKTLLTTADTMLDIARAEEDGVDFVRGMPGRQPAPHAGPRARRRAAPEPRCARADGWDERAGAARPGPRHRPRTRWLSTSTTATSRCSSTRCWCAPARLPSYRRSPAPTPIRVLTTRQVFDLRDLPEHLVVLGAGPTGCEFADFFSRCGSRVTLVSARDQILPNDDPDLAEVLEEVFLRRGMDVIKNGRAPPSTPRIPAASGWCWRTAASWTAATCCCASACGPTPLGLGLESAGVEFGERGALPVDEFCAHQRPPHLRLRRRDRADHARQHRLDARPHRRHEGGRRPHRADQLHRRCLVRIHPARDCQGRHLRARCTDQRHAGAGHQAPDPGESRGP